MWARPRVAWPRAATATAGERSAPFQPPASWYSAAAAAAAERASSSWTSVTRSDTSSRAATMLRIPRTATAATATVMKAAARRTPSGDRRRRRGDGSVVTVDPEPVAHAEDRLDDRRMGRVGLDLAAQVADVAVHGPLETGRRSCWERVCSAGLNLVRAGVFK